MQSEAQSLCLACGLCCDGTLFTHTPLRGDSEVAAFVGRADKRRTLPLLAQASVTQGTPESAGEDASGLQPCGHWQATTGCQIYAERPHVCCKFRCKLHRALELKEITLASARAVVTETRAHIAALEVDLPLDAGSYSEAFTQQLAKLPAKEIARYSRSGLLKLGRLQIWIKRHFLVAPNSNAP